ncbi:trigger factor [Hyalangium gracile]|uniref:hypothetical protein n=1 Tax=Hyalangium gracile TaxID=394092 RepID=UPI001CC9C783|nr:hypothetical protein [Hyalangium gracile]
MVGVYNHGSFAAGGELVARTIATEHTITAEGQLDAYRYLGWGAKVFSVSEGVEDRQAPYEAKGVFVPAVVIVQAVKKGVKDAVGRAKANIQQDPALQAKRAKDTFTAVADGIKGAREQLPALKRGGDFKGTWKKNWSNAANPQVKLDKGSLVKQGGKVFNLVSNAKKLPGQLNTAIQDARNGFRAGASAEERDRAIGSVATASKTALNTAKSAVKLGRDATNVASTYRQASQGFKSAIDDAGLKTTKGAQRKAALAATKAAFTEGAKKTDIKNAARQAVTELGDGTRQGVKNVITDGAKKATTKAANRALTQGATQAADAQAFLTEPCHTRALLQEAGGAEGDTASRHSRARHGLRSHPFQRATAPMDTTSVPLPEARLNSSAPIRVTVPAPAPLTEEELTERFTQLAREHAELRDREWGEPVELGDDVRLNIIGYANQKLIPFSIRSGWWMQLEPQDALPGFSEALAGSAVGDCVGIELVLPESYPVASLRGVRARFMVDLLGAREVVLPDPSSEEFLRKLGRGSTLAEVMKSLGQELLEDRENEQWLEARNRVLDELASRVEVKLPASLIDEEIRRRWETAEGEVVRENDFSPAEAAEALQAWRTDPATRADVEKRLRVSLALKAVAERDGLKLELGEVFGVLENYMEAYGLEASEVREALVTPATAAPLRNLAWHLRAVEHVMEQAEIEFEASPPSH